MSFQSLIESDRWAVGRERIQEEIARRMGDLLHVTTLEQLSYQKGYIEGLKHAIDAVDPPNEDC